MKNILFIIKQSPLSLLSQEDAELILANISLNNKVDLLFIGPGVLQLIEQQNLIINQQKDFTAYLKSLPLYGINQIYVSEQSIKAYQGLNFISSITLATPDIIQELLAQADHCFTL